MHESRDRSDNHEHGDGDLVEVETKRIMQEPRIESTSSENLNGATFQVNFHIEENG
jgi:hypothetical protein